MNLHVQGEVNGSEKRDIDTGIIPFTYHNSEHRDEQNNNFATCFMWV